MTIYFRFIFKKLTLNFLICYISLLFSYFLTDLFSHTSIPPPSVILLNFLAMILLRADLLVSLAFLLALLGTLLSLNEHREIMACQAAGFSKWRILFPFYLFTLLLALFSYANGEWGTPFASGKLRVIKKSRKIAKASPFSMKILPDKSRVLFQVDENGIHDFYWIRSHQDILHCKRLIFEEETPIGLFVDIFSSSENDLLEKKASIDKMVLDMRFKEMKNQPFMNHYSSLSRLFRLLTTNILSIISDREKVLTFLLYKLLYPLFPLFFLTILSPAFISYRRTLNPYFTFLKAILAYLIFYSFIKTFILLGENYILSPWITLVLPFVLLQGFFSVRLSRCET